MLLFDSVPGGNYSVDSFPSFYYDDKITFTSRQFSEAESQQILGFSLNRQKAGEATFRTVLECEISRKPDYVDIIIKVANVTGHNCRMSYEVLAATGKLTLSIILKETGKYVLLAWTSEIYHNDLVIADVKTLLGKNYYGTVTYVLTTYY